MNKRKKEGKKRGYIDPKFEDEFYRRRGECNTPDIPISDFDQLRNAVDESLDIKIIKKYIIG